MGILASQVVAISASIFFVLVVAMARFQVKLGDNWQDFSTEEDRALRSALEASRKKSLFQTGRKKPILTLRGQRYEFDFKRMTQTNLSTGKVRDIRPPRSGGLSPAHISASGATPLRVCSDPVRSTEVPIDAIILPETAVSIVAPATDKRMARVEEPRIPEQPPSIPRPMTMQALRGFGDPVEAPIGASPLVAPALGGGSMLTPSAPPPTMSCSSVKPSPQPKAGVVLDLF